MSNIFVLRFQRDLGKEDQYFVGLVNPHCLEELNISESDLVAVKYKDMYLLVKIKTSEKLNPAIFLVDRNVSILGFRENCPVSVINIGKPVAGSLLDVSFLDYLYSPPRGYENYIAKKYFGKIFVPDQVFYVEIFGERYILKVVKTHPDNRPIILESKTKISLVPYPRYPKTNWDSIGGFDDVKNLIIRIFIRPRSLSYIFDFLEIPKPRGLLLYGPKGCGKTLFVRAIGNYLKKPVISVNVLSLFSHSIDTTARRLMERFALAKKNDAIIHINGIDMFTDWMFRQLDLILSDPLFYDVMVIGEAREIHGIPNYLFGPHKFIALSLIHI